MIAREQMESLLRWQRDVNGELDGLRTLDRVEAAPVFNVTARGAFGDGTTDDSSAIQSAMDDAHAVGGGIVYIPRSASAYTLDSGFLNFSNLDNVILAGDGPGVSVIKVASGSTVSQIARLENCSNITFVGLEFDGLNANTTTNRHCVRVWQNSQDIRFLNCHFHDGSGPQGDALYLNDNDANQGAFIDNIRRVWASNCRFSGCSRNGMSVISAREVYITDLLTHDNALYGLDIEPNNASETVSGIHIKGLHAIDNEEYGLIVFNNVGATVKDIQVAGFHVEGSNTVGSMRVKGANMHARFVSGAVVGGPVSGIVVDNTSSFITFENVTSRSHNQNGWSFPSDTGASSFVKLLGCDAIANGHHGMSIRDINNLEIAGGNIVNNSTASGGTRGGITLFGCTGVRITGVRATDTQGTPTQRHGIRFQGTCDNLIITDNDCRGNVTAFIDDDGTATTYIVRDNIGRGASGIAFTDGDTTPSVGAQDGFFVASNGSATTITDFDDGVDGQVITIHFTNGNTTVQDGTNIFLSGSANWNPGSQDTLTLQQRSGNWYEISRSDN